jgi:hypothetical protein
MTMRRIAIGLGLVMATHAASAHAQDIGFGAHAMPTGEARITPRWDHYLFTGNHTTGGGAATLDTGGTSWAAPLSIQADFRSLVVNLTLPMAFLHEWNTSNVANVHQTDDQFELGNLELEGLANIDLGTEHRLLVGGGIAIPTATDQLSDTMGARTLNAYGAIVRSAAWHSSNRNPLAWADQTFGLWATGAYRWASEWVLVRASGSVALYLPTHGAFAGGVGGGGAAIIQPSIYAPGEGMVARGQVELMMSLDVSGAIRIQNMIDAGVSFLGWALPSGAGAPMNPDLGQTAVTLFVQTDEALDFPLGGGFEWIFDLDESWGPTGNDRRFWGAHAYIYGRFDIGNNGAVTTPDFHPTTTSEPVTIAPAGTVPSIEGSSSGTTTTTTTTP